MDFFRSLDFASHVEDLMRQHHVPGLAIAVTQNDQTAAAGYGKATLEPPADCTADTLFDIASSAKSLTAAAVGLLVDDNERYPEVQYDAAMSGLLPDDFVMPGDEYTRGVTVEDVLSHRTGMAGHDNSYMSPRAAQPDDARSVTRNLRNLPVAAPLRSRYLYCNMMFTVATHLVEAKTRQSFSDFLQERLFRPLGMRSTSLQPQGARARYLEDRMAMGYLWDKASSAYHGFPSLDCPEGQGAGSIITSVNDFIKWVRALMNRQEPITEKVYQGLVRMRSLVNPNARRLKPYTSPILYAAGLEVYFYRGHMVVGHDGAIPGFGSRFFFLPDFRFGAVVLGNSSGGGTVATILVRELIDEVLQVPEAERSYRIKSKTPQSAAKGRLALHPKAQSQHRPKNKERDWGRDEEADVAGPKGKDKDKDKKGAGSQKTRGSRLGNSPPQETPLEAYVGVYQNPGYHSLTVQTKDDRLFIDATDRSMGFTLVFDHVSGQTKYTAHLSDYLEGGDDPVEAEFLFDHGRAVKMGLRLEMALKGLIWFERVDEGLSAPARQ